MNEIKQYVFTEIETDGGTYRKNETTYICPSDSPWMPIMLQFATFLEGCGYVGVVERMEDFL
jgi:hypothetical protein